MNIIYYLIISFAVFIYTCRAVYVENWARGIVSTLINGAILWYAFGSWSLSSLPSFDTVVKYAVWYIGAGLLWSMIEWRKFVKSRFTKFKEVMTLFVERLTDLNRPISFDDIQSTTDSDTLGELRKKIRNYFFEGAYSLGKVSHLYRFRSDSVYSYKDLLTDCKPYASEHLSTLGGWIAFWPICIVNKIGYLIGNTFSFLGSLFSGVYEHIAFNNFK